MSPTLNPEVVPFFHAASHTYAYVVTDPATRATALVDVPLDFDAASGRVDTLLADAVLAHVHRHDLDVRWILETHAHADHLSAGDYLRRATGAPLAIGEGIRLVQARFADWLRLGADFVADGSQFDRLLHDGEKLPLGKLHIEALHTPGHTSDSLCYAIGDTALLGDTLFAPDVGSARCDFPGGDAATLWRSMQRILALPAATRLYVAHDYPPPGREPRAQWAIADQRERNAHIANQTEQTYVDLRQARDARLPPPQLLFPSLQVNLRAGVLPPAAANGRRYLVLPLTLSASLA
jgi:glyoxylase-like metal-dependent hydrolase (beta-lactamase superfamily II)